MECEFEERQFEQHFNNELANKGRMYIPGQVFENKIAIDAAIFSNNPKFWKLWSNSKKKFGKSGVLLNQELWELIEETWKNEMFPKFKCNVFIQYKRPQYIYSKLGKEYFLWNQPYFRYNLDDNQQKILFLLEKRLSSRGLVVYACPAFYKKSDLWRFIRGKLVENTNFVKPTKLNNHQRYTFIKKGKGGIAFSQPREIDGILLLEKINQLIEESSDYENNVQFINVLSKQVKLLIEETDEKTRKDFNQLRKQVRFPDNELGYNIFNILTFSMFTNTIWGIGYKVDPPRKKIDYLTIKNGRLEGFLENLDLVERPSQKKIITI